MTVLQDQTLFLSLWFWFCSSHLSTTLKGTIEAESSKVFESFCETEAFNASCPAGQAILITHAHYGRMKLNRCVKHDYGHVGCAADVIELTDARCSGRSRCEIAIPDVMFAKTRPCPEDLKPYLEVGYNCVPVQAPPRPCHQRPGSLPVSSLPSGYLTSHVTEVTGCGTSLTPWVIEAETGQTVRVELFDFNVLELAARQLSFVDHQYPVYAVLREILATGVRNLTICGGTTRERLVYTSVTNRLEIAFTVNADKSVGSFMLRYEAQGCTETVAVVNAWILRYDDHLIVKCNNSRQEYYLTCIGDRWIGEAVNCSPDSYSLSWPERIDNTDVTISYGIYVVIVLFTSGLVGLLVLMTGLSIIKRRRVWCISLMSPHGSPLSTTGDKLYLTRNTRGYSDTPIRLIGPTAIISEMGNYFVNTPPELQRCIAGNAASLAGEGLERPPASRDIAGSRGRCISLPTRSNDETAVDPTGAEDVESIAKLSREGSWYRQTCGSHNVRPGMAVVTDRDSESPVLRTSECNPLILEAEECREEEEGEESEHAASHKYILFTFSS